MNGSDSNNGLMILASVIFDNEKIPAMEAWLTWSGLVEKDVFCKALLCVLKDILADVDETLIPRQNPVGHIVLSAPGYDVDEVRVPFRLQGGFSSELN